MALVTEYSRNLVEYGFRLVMILGTVSSNPKAAMLSISPLVASTPRPRRRFEEYGSHCQASAALAPHTEPYSFQFSLLSDLRELPPILLLGRSRTGEHSHYHQPKYSPGKSIQSMFTLETCRSTHGFDVAVAHGRREVVEIRQPFGRIECLMRSNR